MTVAWNTGDDYRVDQAGNADRILFSGLIEDTSSASYETLAVTGIPFTTYDVYVYVGSDVNARTGHVRLNGGGVETYFWTNSDPFQGYVRAVGTSGGDANSATYALYEGVSGAALDIEFMNDNGNLGVHGFQIVDATLTAIVYGGTTFSEHAANDGSIGNAIVLTLYGETFTGTVGDDLVAAGKVSVAHLPSGLSLVARLDSSTQVTLSLSGHAVDHDSADDVVDLGVAFLDGAFALGVAGAVDGASRTDLAIAFLDSSPVIASVTTGDADADGYVDRIVLVFGGNVDVVDGNGSDGLPQIALGGGYVVADGDYAATNVSTLTLNLVERSSPDTDAQFDVTFVNDGDVTLADSTSIWVADYSGTCRDGAGPAIVLAQTVTTASVVLVFSEPICDASFMQGDVTFSGFPVAEANALGGAPSTGVTPNDEVMIVALAAVIGADDTGSVAFTAADVIYDEAAVSNTNSQTASIPVSDGTGSTPSITGIVADDPDDLDIVYGVGDTITVVFNTATDHPPASVGVALDAAAMDARYALSNGSWGDSADTYDVAWTNVFTLRILVRTVGSADIAIGVDALSVQAAAGIHDYASTSASATGTSPVLTGDWGTALPGAFMLVIPCNGSAGAAIAPELIWSASANVVTYALSVDDDSDFSAPEINETALTSTTYEAPAPVLTAGTVYYWRVVASNPNGGRGATNNGIWFVTSASATPTDWDGDGLTNTEEAGLGTSPHTSDTDHDGMPDPWELANGTQPTVADGNGDPDGDGISNLDEYRDGTDPRHNNFPGITGGTGSCVPGDAPAAGMVLVMLALWALRCRRSSDDAGRPVRR
jgi:hypothetical protein